MTAISPETVPHVRLASGATMPAIGLGTFGSDAVPPEAVGAAVRSAAEIGYRHFDCAAVYGNEAEVGKALADVMAAGVQREELWVTSKLWNDSHHPDKVIPACERSLRALGLEYLDLYLIHWPFPNHHPPGASVTARDHHARPYIHERYLETWGQLERLHELGLVRHIGTSNMSRAKLELLLRDCRVRPAANQMELHPHFQQPDLFAYVCEQQLVPIGFSPLGSPGRPARDRTPEDSSPTEDPVIVEIARRHDLHPAQVCIAWAVQRGQVPIPFSTKPRNQLANLAAAVAAPLSDDEMRAIAAIDRNCRLIKGQVFLWREGQDWRDLWDEDGVIAQ